jgi:hypothetical protein
MCPGLHKDSFSLLVASFFTSFCLVDLPYLQSLIPNDLYTNISRLHGSRTTEMKVENRMRSGRFFIAVILPLPDVRAP